MPNNTVDKADRNKLLFLDGLRGLAALYVMVGHARWLLWEGFQKYSEHTHEFSAINKAFVYGFSLFKYGHEVVLFFFVLSGFVIHLRFATNYQKDKPIRFDYPDYMWRRFKRIYPPFICALLITLCLDFIGKNMGFSIYVGTTKSDLINNNVSNPDLQIKTFFGSLMFLYENYFPVFGTNGPAWSLKYEWWFYTLFPIFLLIGKRNILLPTALMICLFAASFFPAYWPESLLPDIFSMMITWWLGVLLAEVYVGRLKIKLQFLSLTCVSILFFFLPFTLQNVWKDLIMALFFFGMLAFLLKSNENNRLKKILERLKILGDFSYTLYIIHFPILVFLAGWVLKFNNNQQPDHFGFVFLGILGTIGISYFLHFVTEVPFVRKTNSTVTKPKELASIIRQETIVEHRTGLK